MIQQRFQISDMIIHRIGRFTQIGQAVAALVIGQNGAFADKADDDIAPDAEIRAQRVDKHHQQRSFRRADHLIMKIDAVYCGKLHVCPARIL